MTRRRRPRPAVLSATLLAVAIGACGGGEPSPAARPTAEDAEIPGEPPLPQPPWTEPALLPSEAPGPYLEVWREAENRSTCAPLAPASLLTDRPATPRPATFAGGWGVAYDLPGLRSAFGVAGTGVSPSPDTYDEWPYRIAWQGGSSAGYGPEGGTGPNQLAYLRVAGQDCLYNVWSRLGREHLEQLLANLRLVQVHP